MPEWGQLPIPKKLLAQGVRDMLRISDARMSGTSYGACVLHVAPESHVGGPLAFVQDGDLIELDVPRASSQLKVDDAELARRRAAWKPPAAALTRAASARCTRARHAGQRGLRLRFPRRHRSDRGAGDPLSVADCSRASQSPMTYYGAVEGTGFEVIEAEFRACLVGHARVERLWTGARWAEGPAWFGAGRYLIWSDIPNNRMLRLDDCDGRSPSSASRRTTPTATRSTTRAGSSPAST